MLSAHNFVAYIERNPSMPDKNKTNYRQLVDELTELRSQIAEYRILETKHLDSEKTLREELSKYRQVIDRANEAIIATQNRVIRFAGGSCLEVTGYSKEDWISSDSFTDFAHPDDRKNLEDFHTRQMQGDNTPSRFDCRFLCKDRSVKWVSIDSYLVLWDGQRTSLAFMTDITERKRTEATLIERQFHFRSLLETIPDALIVYDDQGKVTFANAAFEQLYGWSMEELVNRGLTNFVPPEQQEVTRHYWERTVRGEKAVFETQRYDKEGKVLDLQLSTAILSDMEGKHTTSIVIHHDITDRKRAQEELRKSHQDIKNANSLILDSIHYTRSIQTAILPSDERLSSLLDDYFIIWKPRDIIGGDMYWVDGGNEEVVFAVIDCTGHGVPGAIMTMIAATSLNRAVHEVGYRDPGTLLGKINVLVRETLRRRPEGELYDDGLDMGICYVNKRSRKATFASGRISLFVCDDGEVTEIKGDTESLGYQSSDPDHRFRNHHVELSNSIDLYLTTDGLTEQIGGPNRLPFGKRRFIRFISENRTKSLLEQRVTLLEMFLDYRAEEDQRDDVTVLGVRV